MQFNPKKHVDIFEMVDEIIKRINKTVKKNNINKIYEVRIKDGTYKSNITIKATKKNKPFKTILLVSSDLDTREQIVLFSCDYTIKNPADLLRSNYKKHLYKELLYSCLISFAIVSENTIKQQRVEKSIEMKKRAEQPLTPNEAFDGTTKEEDIVANMK